MARDDNDWDNDLGDEDSKAPEARPELDLEAPPFVPENPWRRIARSFVLMVGVPTLVAALYYAFVASDIYVSETRFAIRSGDDSVASGMLSAMLGSVGGSSGGSASSDALIVRDYIHSHDMLAQLQEVMNLRAHYGASTVDPLARLAPDASEEDFLAFYRDMVDITIDSASGITVLGVRAFDPRTAQETAENLIRLSEQLVNQLSNRITEDTLRIARKEANNAEARIREASAQVTRFRNESRSIDPGRETSAVMSIVTNLENQLAAARAELAEVQAFMRSDSTKVRNLRAKVTALQEQVDQERNRLASETGTDLTLLIDSYEPLVLEQRLSEQRYTSALTSLEVSRAEAQRKQRYLLPFVSPVLPDEPTEPARVQKTATVFLGALLIYIIGGLIVSAVNEHTGV